MDDAHLPEPGRERFSKHCRLYHPQQFKKVFEKSKKFFSTHLIVFVRSNELTCSRVGVIIKRKNVKRAVDRNKLKRTTRESFRRCLDLRRMGLDLIVLIRSQVDKKTLRNELDTQWQKIITSYKKYS